MQATLAQPIARHQPIELTTQPEPATHTAALLEELSVDSQWLLRGNKSIAIVHNGTVYRLQSTKLGKLILTK